ncbi:hypothetical protein JW835_03160 [bacterium]|nr:hypothetical protein [bacterium]
MQNRIKILFFLLSLFMACHRNTLPGTPKMNAKLRQQVQEQTEVIYFTGECRSDITLQIRQRIENTGIQIKNVKGNIFSAKGAAGQIQQLSKLDFIVRLQASPVYQYKYEEQM